MADPPIDFDQALAAIRAIEGMGRVRVTDMDIFPLRLHGTCEWCHADAVAVVHVTRGDDDCGSTFRCPICRNYVKVTGADPLWT